MKHATMAFLCLTLMVASHPLGAQEPVPQAVPSSWPEVEIAGPDATYEPQPELIVLYVSSSWCAGNQAKRLDVAVRTMKDSLSRRAARAQYGFAAIGMSVDEDLAKGLRHLIEGESDFGRKTFGPWSEVVVGRSWLNSASSLYVLEHGVRHLSVPSIYVLDRTVLPAPRFMEVAPSRLLLRLSGTSDIERWLDEGFPVPGFPAEDQHGARQGDFR